MSKDPFLVVVDRFNETRDFSTKGFKSVCYAPFVSMYLDQKGDVRVCCWNTQNIVGNITRQSLDEIWNGAKIQVLRNALQACDMKHGCDFCEWQFLEGNHDGTFIRRFDDYSAPHAAPQYPQLMEFSISNTCNLECVMCNGEWSSSIRTRREKLPPLPKLYGDTFFEQLRPFLPHLKRANFYGGEPFLERETYRIWDMMIEMGLETSCCATTNATQYNAKVERVIEKLPFMFNISMDGVTKETVEKIRKNAKHEVVLENFQRFHAYAKKRDTYIGLTYCMMVLNWNEFGDYLLFGDDWDVDVTVNTVTFPQELSLYHLPIGELRTIVDAMESKNDFYCNRLSRNRQVWINELERLRHAVDHQNDERFFKSIGWGTTLEQTATSDAMTAEQAKAILADWSEGATFATINCDEEMKIRECDVQSLTALKLDDATLVGRPLSDIPKLLSDRLGGNVEHLQSERTSTHIDDVTLFRDGNHQLFVRAISLPTYDDSSKMVGLHLTIACRTSPLADFVELEMSPKA